jgi:hypothetical protein
MQTKSIIIIVLCKSLINTIYFEYYTEIEICLAVSLGVFSLTEVQGKVRGKKIPWVIKKLNKALGLGRKSKKVWDILSISDNTANIKKYHPEEKSK